MEEYKFADCLAEGVVSYTSLSETFSTIDEVTNLEEYVNNRFKNADKAMETLESNINKYHKNFIKEKNLLNRKIDKHNTTIDKLGRSLQHQIIQHDKIIGRNEIDIDTAKSDIKSLQMNLYYISTLLSKITWCLIFCLSFILVSLFVMIFASSNVNIVFKVLSCVEFLFVTLCVTRCGKILSDLKEFSKVYK